MEADEEHVKFARDCLLLNGFDPAFFKVLTRVASACSGKALFPRQADSGLDWGVQPVFNASIEQTKVALEKRAHDIVQLVSLPEILHEKQHFDLLHLDIQGGEAELLSNRVEKLRQHVAYVVVGTHSREIEGKIFEVVPRNRFALESERPAILQLSDNKAPQVVVYGVQAWRNPHLLPF